MMSRKIEPHQKRKMKGVAGRNFIAFYPLKKMRRDIIIHNQKKRNVFTIEALDPQQPLASKPVIVVAPHKERRVATVFSSSSFNQRHPVSGGITAVRLEKIDPIKPNFSMEVPPARQALWEGVQTVIKNRTVLEGASYQACLDTTVIPLAESCPELYRRQAMTSIQNAHVGIKRAAERAIVAHKEALHVICTDTDDASCLMSLRKIIPEAPAELLGLATEARVRHALFEFDRCTLCDSPLEMDVVENSLLCATCGSRRACPDPGGMAMSVTYYNLDRRQTLFGHKRLTKLREYLKQLLGKQKSVVPMSVLLDIASHLTNVMGLQDPEKVKYRSVHAALVALDMRNFFDYCMQIYCRIRGCPPPTLHPESDEAICVLFAAIQRPFEELKEKTSSTFFSISYLVLTLCKFLNYSHLTPFITLSHSPARLYAQEKLLRLVFEKLNWRPFPELHADDFE